MPLSPFPSRNSASGRFSQPISARSGLQTSHVTRRCNASKPPVGQQAPATATTIPGPSWLWLEPIYEPFRAYGRVQQRRPYMTQLISSLVIYFVGDLVAQSIAQPAPPEVLSANGEEDAVEKGWVQDWSDNRDWARTGRAIMIGGLSSIPSYRWFLWLSNNFNYTSKILSLSVKVGVNQVLFTPLFNSYFFGMQSLLSGATAAEIIERIKNTVPTSWINSCKLWPIVTAFSFTYIPIQYRSIFGGVIAIGWQTYLSLLNQRAAALEEKDHAGVERDVALHNSQVVTVREERGHEEQKCAA
ncbi:hypothetical protein ACN47E_004183 [Coniothyrium glycines]